MNTVTRPITCAIAALGGQGGGVLTDWLVRAARHAAHIAQATSVPGVAQRTGATVYYLEFYPRAALPADGREPIMALMPSPGDVDVLVASELAEGARAVLRGFAGAERTTAIVSTHREYTVAEKIVPGDGRVPDARLLDAVRKGARRCVAFDMAETATRSGGRISAVVLGAVSAAGVLPFPDESYRAAIRDSGVAVEANLAAYACGRERALAEPDPMQKAPTADADAGSGLSPHLAARLDAEFPPALHALLAHAVARLIDYQDDAYADEYLDRLAAVLALEPAPAQTVALTAAVARGLALWMTFEDPIRVADLKTRVDRRARIAREMTAAGGEVVGIVEFLKPRAAEILGSLPPRTAAWVAARPRLRHTLETRLGGWHVNVETIGGYALLRGLAALRRWRRHTARYAEESTRMRRWLDTIAALRARDYALAVEVAESQRLLKGYGATYERGYANFCTLLARAATLAGEADAARRVRALHDAALADDTGAAFEAALASPVTV